MDNSKLTTKQFTIPLYLYRFRFLTSIQLQKLLNIKTLHLTNYYLKILSTQNYINKHYSRSLGLANQPAIYFLSLRSINVLKNTEGVTTYGIRRIYREKIRSPKFIAHASFIANYYLFILTDSNETKYTLNFFTKSDLLNYPDIIHPLPDAYFTRVNKDKETKRYFVEVIDEGTPRFVLRKRIEQYNDYIEDGKFEEATGHDFPTLLFICPGYASLIYLKKHISRIYEETSLDQIEIYVATRDGAYSGSWEKIEAEGD